MNNFYKNKLIYTIMIYLLFISNAYSKVGMQICLDVFAGEQRANGLFVPKFNLNDNEIIFIAKIYNQVDIKNKKIFMVVKPIANIKSNIEEFKVDITIFYEKYIKQKNIGCDIMWQLKGVGSYKVMLVTSKKRAFIEKKNPSSSNEMELNQFLNNSIGFYLRSDELKIHDLSNDIQSWNRYIDGKYFFIANKKQSNKELDKLANNQKRLNLKYFNEFKSFLNKEIEDAIKQNKISKDTIESIRNLINKKNLTGEDTLKDIVKVLSQENIGMDY